MKRVVHVVIENASSLQSVSYWGNQNPYVSVSTLPDKSITKRTQAHQEGNSDPSWNEELHNHLIMDITSLPDCSQIFLEIFDEGAVSDDLIGSTFQFSCLINTQE
jgi:Ca2+-dependent lipid-binding protein